MFWSKITSRQNVEEVLKFKTNCASGSQIQEQEMIVYDTRNPHLLLSKIPIEHLHEYVYCEVNRMQDAILLKFNASDFESDVKESYRSAIVTLSSKIIALTKEHERREKHQISDIGRLKAYCGIRKVPKEWIKNLELLHENLITIISASKTQWDRANSNALTVSFNKFHYSLAFFVDQWLFRLLTFYDNEFEEA